MQNSGEKISPGNSNLFKDSKNNLWIGDVNRLIKIDSKGEVINLYKDVQPPDSTRFEIKALTEDYEENIYYLNVITKTLHSTEQNGTKISWVETKIEIVKYDGEKSLTLFTIDGEAPSGFMKNLFFHENKLYFSVGSVLYLYDVFDENLDKIPIKKPNYIDIPELDWEEVNSISINKIFEFDNQIYALINIKSDISYFNCIAKYDENSKKFKYFSLPRNYEYDAISGINSIEIINDEIFCSEWYNAGDDPMFYIFKNDMFSKLNVNSDATPQLIANPIVYESIKTRWSKLNTGAYNFNNDMHFDNHGNLYAGTNKGLIILESFYNTNSVNSEEIKIKTIPELTKVNNEIYIESEYIINSYRIIDINSKILQSVSDLNFNNINLNVKDFANGIYFIVLETQKGNKLLKFIKN